MDEPYTPSETDKQMVFWAPSIRGEETSFNLQELLESGKWRNDVYPNQAETHALIEHLHTSQQARRACLAQICEWRAIERIPHDAYR